MEEQVTDSVYHTAKLLVWEKLLVLGFYFASTHLAHVVLGDALSK